MPFTDTQKFEAAMRGLKKRQQVYPRLIEAVKLSSEKAKYEIDIMADIARDYGRAAKAERLL